MRASHASAHDAGVRRIAVVAALGVLLVLPGSAGAVLTPGRTVVNAAPVTALSVTGRSVAYAIGRTKANCGTVRLWDTATRGLWTFGSKTIIGCEEGFSGGFGISQVATSRRRVFWVTNVGGNITDYQLWTATPTRPTPRRLAFASSESGYPPAVVLGSGTREGVPYAVGDTVTYVSDSGVRLFRVRLGSPVRLLTAGFAFGGPDTTSVMAALANGDVVQISRSGANRSTDAYTLPVRAIHLATVGTVVQLAGQVRLTTASVVTRIPLPAGALMLDYRQRGIVYRQGTQVRLRKVATGSDTLLQVIPVKPWQPILFSTDSGGVAWAKGATVSWRSGPLG